MVRTEQLVKHFHDPKKPEPVRAVDGISIEAHPGQIFGLLGANGAGKTTMLRVLSTVLEPTSGKAWVNDHNVVEEPREVRRSIGFMSNSTALYGRLTAREMLEYFGQLYDLEGAKLKERVDYALDRMQIHEFADRLCDKLSTGQKQRVSIGRTMLHDPPVLFFDEPTAGLDVVMSQAVMEFIEEQRDAGKTIVFSTHIMSEVERLCDWIAVIHEGKIQTEGTVADLLAETGEKNLEAAFLKLVEYKRGMLAEVAK